MSHARGKFEQDRIPVPPFSRDPWEQTNALVARVTWRGGADGSGRGGGARSARAKAAAALTALIEGGEKKEQKEKNRIAAVEAMALPAVERLVRDISKSADAESHKQGRSGLEAALRCLGALLAGDTLLRAIFVEEGGLSALWPLAAIEPAAAAVLDAFDDCFGDLIAAEKEKVKDAAPAPPTAPPKKKADKAKGAC